MESLGIEVEKKNAEKTKLLLLKKNLLDNSLLPFKKEEKVVFPIKCEPKKGIGKIIKAEFKETAKKPKNMKQALSKTFSLDELKLVPSSFDLLGDCAIIELEEKIQHRAKEIAEALLSVNKQVKSVFLKSGAHSGVYRCEPVVFLAGEKTNKANYVEHGCKFKISIGQVFFSPRLSSERKRIAGIIKKGEKVACLFSGVGPFPIVFAKHSKMGSAIAIELNPIAYQDMVENISINKLEGKIKPLFGDVKEFATMTEYAGKFDRVVMPLPKGGEDFLTTAIRYVKQEGGVIHYYQFSDSKKPFEAPLEQIRKACEETKMVYEVIFQKKVRDYAPNIIQVVIDFKVRKR